MFTVLGSVSDETTQVIGFLTFKPWNNVSDKTKSKSTFRIRKTNHVAMTNFGRPCRWVDCYTACVQIVACLQ